MSWQQAVRSSAVLSLCVALLAGPGCQRDKSSTAGSDKGEVIVYTALDRGFSEPIFKRFQAETGIRVRPKYDTESTKTVGLVNAIRAEKARPRCDVFWNNEIVNTIRLKDEGLLAPCEIAAAKDYPQMAKDLDGYWYGFAARARVIIVNAKMVKPEQDPKSIFDLTKPQWKGKVGIAKPLFGTTATHAACLFATLGEARAKKWFEDLLANDVQIQAGNRLCADNVAAGRLAVGLTDTDDAMGHLEAGKPVRIVYPDAGQDDLGVLYIPNTLSVVKGGPNPQQAVALVEYLLRPEVEIALASGPSAQIPLNPKVTVDLRVKGPNQCKPMDVDFGKAARLFQQTAEYIKKSFLKAG
jgi:iron(III) transport system substrate-binding protein